MIFETPRRRYPNFCAWNAPWKVGRNLTNLGIEPKTAQNAVMKPISAGCGVPGQPDFFNLATFSSKCPVIEN